MSLVIEAPHVLSTREPFVIIRDTLMQRARFPEDIRTQALAGVIARGMAQGAERTLRGLDDDEFQRLLRAFFPGVVLHNGYPPAADVYDEYDDLIDLLRAFCCDESDVGIWLCHAIASAAMRDHHLWQDMGLPHRGILNLLLLENFPELVVRNSGDMKWKKFFYRQLCERAGVLLCKSPNCTVCVDHAICFGPEV